MNVRVRTALLAAVVMLLGAGCGNRQPGAHGDAGVRLSNPVAKVPFTLTATNGEPFDFMRETEGRVTLVFFGYTNCPDICPVHMANLAAALEHLPLEVSSAITVVFVTTDPERDTPDRLREWLDAFSSDFIGLTGAPDQLERIQRALRLTPAIRDEEQAGGYLVSHAAHIMAFTPDDSAHVVFPFGTRQSDWARELPRLVDR